LKSYQFYGNANQPKCNPLINDMNRKPSKITRSLGNLVFISFLLSFTAPTHNRSPMPT